MRSGQQALCYICDSPGVYRAAAPARPQTAAPPKDENTIRKCGECDWLACANNKCGSVQTGLDGRTFFACCECHPPEICP